MDGGCVGARCSLSYHLLLVLPHGDDHNVIYGNEMVEMDFEMDLRTLQNAFPTSRVVSLRLAIPPPDRRKRGIHTETTNRMRMISKDFVYLSSFISFPLLFKRSFKTYAAPICRHLGPQPTPSLLVVRHKWQQ